MRFHLAQLSMTLSDLKRSIEVRHISEGRNLEPLANLLLNLLSMVDRKSYMVFHFVAFALT